jgi:hypothetical protein
MKTLNALINEVFGMFVDDGSLAIAILVMVAVAAWVSMRFANASAVVGAILFIGVLATLVENIVRTTRKPRP